MIAEYFSSLVDSNEAGLEMLHALLAPSHQHRDARLFAVRGSNTISRC